jgi:hypothetical protein
MLQIIQLVPGLKESICNKFTFSIIPFLLFIKYFIATQVLKIMY